jgi:hypothetical protein
MFRMTVTALALAVSTAVAFAASDAELREAIVGSWGQDATCSTGTLTFNTDGTFTLIRPDRNETGTWSIAGGMLTGIASDGSARPEVGVSVEGDAMIFKFGTQQDKFARCAS